MQLLELAVERLIYHDNGALHWRAPAPRYGLEGREAGVVSTTDGYRYIKIAQKRIPAHRIVFWIHHGYVPEEIDHINRVRDDNRIENLRDCRHVENSRNQGIQRKVKSSEYKGVVWDKSRGKWMASTKMEGRSVFLGRFDRETDAALAYNEFAKRHFGEFATLNEV